MNVFGKFICKMKKKKQRRSKGSQIQCIHWYSVQCTLVYVSVSMCAHME